MAPSLAKSDLGSSWQWRGFFRNRRRNRLREVGVAYPHSRCAGRWPQCGNNLMHASPCACSRKASARLGTSPHMKTETALHVRRTICPHRGGGDATPKQRWNAHAPKQRLGAAPPTSKQRRRRGRARAARATCTPQTTGQWSRCAASPPPATSGARLEKRISKATNSLKWTRMYHNSAHPHPLKLLKGSLTIAATAAPKGVWRPKLCECLGTSVRKKSHMSNSPWRREDHLAKRAIAPSASLDQHVKLGSTSTAPDAVSLVGLRTTPHHHRPCKSRSLGRELPSRCQSACALRWEVEACTACNTWTIKERPLSMRIVMSVPTC